MTFRFVVINTIAAFGCGQRRRIGSVVSGAVVSGAVVSGAVVSGAVVSGAVVSGAVVSGAEVAVAAHYGRIEGPARGSLERCGSAE